MVGGVLSLWLPSYLAILKGPMAITLGWTAAQVTLGYSLMMVVYAVAA